MRSQPAWRRRTMPGSRRIRKRGRFWVDERRCRSRRSANVEIGQGAQRGLRHGLFGRRRSAPGSARECVPARRSSASFASAEMASSADFLFVAREHRQHGVDDLVIAEAAERAHHHRQRSRRRGGRASRCSRGTARLLPISASASTARSLTHQSLSRVASMRCPTARSSLVWLRISMAARRMSSSWSRTSCSTASTTLRAADLAERVGGAAAHPPVVVVRRASSSSLHRLGVADFVEHFHGRAARVFVLVLEHRDQVLDGLRIVGA